VPPTAQAAHQQASLLLKSFQRRLAGKPLPVFVYRDYGSLVSLSAYSTVGNLMGNLTGNVMIEGWIARLVYRMLYRMHQRALHGTLRAILLMVADWLTRATHPRLKLH
jgi:NADH dehydrogenase